jgi:hypothetical protein
MPARNDPGQLSRTLAPQTGMTTQGLGDPLGLVAIRALWSSLPYPT